MIILNFSVRYIKRCLRWIVYLTGKELSSQDIKIENLFHRKDATGFGNHNLRLVHRFDR